MVTCSALVVLGVLAFCHLFVWHSLLTHEQHVKAEFKGFDFSSAPIDTVSDTVSFPNN